MDVTIRCRECDTHYMLFNVSSIKISLEKYSDDEDTINIHAYNDTLHFNVYNVYKKEEAENRYVKLMDDIRAKKSLFLICDHVFEKD